MTRDDDLTGAPHRVPNLADTSERSENERALVIAGFSRRAARTLIAHAIDTRAVPDTPVQSLAGAYARAARLPNYTTSLSDLAAPGRVYHGWSRFIYVAAHDGAGEDEALARAVVEAVRRLRPEVTDTDDTIMTHYRRDMRSVWTWLLEGDTLRQDTLRLAP